MTKVYVINKSGHDFSPAEKFGELVYLSEGEVNIFHVQQMYRQFSSVLKDSGPRDFILTTGLTIMSCVATAIMARKHGIVNILLFHAETRTYKVRTLKVDELIGDISYE